MYGMYFNTAESTFSSNLKLGLATSVDFVRLIWWSLEDLFSGAIGVNSLTGPIGIVDSMSQMAESSGGLVDAVYNLLYFGALLRSTWLYEPAAGTGAGRRTGLFPAAEWVAVADLPAQIPAQYDGVCSLRGIGAC